MEIVQMNRAQAEEYINWHYETPYDFYTIPEKGIKETYEEIYNDPYKNYYSVLKDRSLFGIFEYDCSNPRELEIGLGICPQETGKGNGKEFVANCVAFGRKVFNYQGDIFLDVASFNQRAIHLYKQLGFFETGRLTRLSYGKLVTFIKMKVNASDCNFDLTYCI
ncbi:MAG: GNAT family protein [Sporolactobacillus sp.]